ncbi:MAG: hypothetical protein NXI24_12665 [bacterium]|nr:hypothetical protein [bacterium]
MSEFRKSHWIRRFPDPVISGKQNPGRFAIGLWFAGVLALLLIGGGAGGSASLAAVSGADEGTVVRPYDLYDPRFCYLTPRPFLCERCLKSGQQFVQRLSFEADGRPVRNYGCRPYARKYLD